MNLDFFYTILSVLSIQDTKMANLQVKSMDDQLYQALGKRAAMDQRSISQEVIFIIKDYLSRAPSQHQSCTDQFLELCGTWQDERQADDIVNELRDSRNGSDSRFSDSL